MCPCRSDVEWREGTGMEGAGAGLYRGHFNQRAWRSLLLGGTPGQCSILCSPSRRSAELTGRPSHGCSWPRVCGGGGMHGGKLFKRGAKQLLPGSWLGSGGFFNKRLENMMIQWNLVTGRTNRVCWKDGVNKQNHRVGNGGRMWQRLGPYSSISSS